MRMGLQIAICCTLVLFAETGPAAPPPTDTGTRVYQHALKSTVWLVVPVARNRAAMGSGALIDEGRRLVLTNYHVVGKRDKVLGFFPSFKRNEVIAERSFYMDLLKAEGGLVGRVVVKDALHDLALVQLQSLPAGVHALRLARGSASPGQSVHSIGNPGRSEALWVYTPGKVRQVYHKRWKAGAGDEIVDLEAQVVMTDSATNPGDSGGPLLNDAGELVGVTQGGATDAQLLSTAIDVSEVRKLLATKGLVKTPPPAVAKEKSESPAPEESQKPEKAAASEESDSREHTAAVKLKLAKQLAKDGLTDKAKLRYQEIIDEFPKTKAAAEARELLDKLD